MFFFRHLLLEGQTGFTCTLRDTDLMEKFRFWGFFPAFPLRLPGAWPVGRQFHYYFLGFFNVQLLVQSFLVFCLRANSSGKVKLRQILGKLAAE